MVIFTKKLNPEYDVLLNKVYKDLCSGEADSAIISTGSSISNYLATYNLKDITPTFGSAELKDLKFRINPTAITADYAINFPLEIFKVKTNLTSSSEGDVNLDTRENCLFSSTFSESNYMKTENFDGEMKGFNVINRPSEFRVKRREISAIVTYSKPYITSIQFENIQLSNDYYGGSIEDYQDWYGSKDEPSKIFLEPHSEYRGMSDEPDRGVMTRLISGVGDAILSPDDNWYGFRPVTRNPNGKMNDEHCEILLSEITEFGGFKYDVIDTDNEPSDETVLVQPINSIFDKVYHDENIYHTYVDADKGRTLVSSADVTFDGSSISSGTHSAKFYSYAADTLSSSDTDDTGGTRPLVEVRDKFNQFCSAMISDIPRPIVQDFAGKDLAASYTRSNFHYLDYCEIMPYIEFDLNIEKLATMYQVDSKGEYITKRSFVVLLGERTGVEGESLKEYIDASRNADAQFVGFSIMNKVDQSRGTNNYQARPLDSWLHNTGSHIATTSEGGTATGIGNIPSKGAKHAVIDNNIRYSNAEAPLGMSFPQSEWVTCRMYLPASPAGQQMRQVPIFFHNSDGTLLNDNARSCFVSNMLGGRWFPNGYENTGTAYHWPNTLSFWLSNHWCAAGSIVDAADKETDTAAGERESIVRLDSIKFCNFEPRIRDNSQSSNAVVATSPLSIGTNKVVAPLKGAGTITGLAGPAITAVADVTFSISSCVLTATTITIPAEGSEPARPKTGMIVDDTGATGKITTGTKIIRAIATGDPVVWSFEVDKPMISGTIEVDFHCVNFSCTAHGLFNGDKITVAGTTHYDGLRQVTRTQSTSVFTIGALWVDTQTGTWVGPFNNYQRLTDTAAQFESDEMDVRLGDAVINWQNGSHSFVTEVVSSTELKVSSLLNTGGNDDDGNDDRGMAVGDTGFSSGDRYFVYGMSRKITVPTYLSFGFKTVAQITGDANLLFSNFSTDDLSNREEIKSDYMRFATNKVISATEKLGRQLKTYKLETNKLTDGTHYEFNGDAYHVDNFTQHGFATFGFADDSSIGGTGAMASRECQPAAARILGFPDEFSIVVSQEAPLGLVDGQEYIIYVHGADAVGGSRTCTLERTGDCTFKIKDLANGLKTFIQSYVTDVDYSDCMWISPKMYWIYGQVSPFDTNDKQVPTRRYGSICCVDDIPTSSSDLGATWNESIFSETYSNSWSLDNTRQSLIEYSHDFGYVSENQEGIDQKVSESAVVKSYISGLSPQLFSNPRSYFFDIVKEDFDSKLTFMYGINSTISKDCSFTVDTREGDDPIQLWVEIEDIVPKAPQEFELAPNDTNAHNIEFTWTAEDDDLWYGILFVSGKQINSQYHNAYAHFPLNETSEGGYVYKPDKGESYLGSGTYRTANGFSSGSGPQPDGLSGYAKNFTTSSDYQKYAGTGFTTPTTKWSAVIHTIPQYITSTDNRTLLYQEDRMRISLQSTSTATHVQAEISDNASSPATITLKSMPVFTDGQTPICVIVTIDAELKNNGAKLFIDGVLADQKDWTAGGESINDTTNNIFIGSDANSSTDEAKAYIEEIVLYNDVIYPIKPSVLSFLYTKEENEINDTATESPMSYNARLFIKDYHNIRGYTKQEVAATGQLTFNKPSFALSLD